MNGAAGLRSTATGAIGSPSRRTFCAPHWSIAIRRPRRRSARSGSRTRGPTPPPTSSSAGSSSDAADPVGIDVLDVEERVVALLDRVLTRRNERDAPTRAVVQRPVPVTGRRREGLDCATGGAAPDARANRARDDCSVFHLCRSFRRATGLTLHDYRDEVRLRLALERLEGGERDLSRLALDLGYSSHSHFTAAFRRSFGAPPSSMRKLLIVRG